MELSAIPMRQDKSGRPTMPVGCREGVHFRRRRSSKVNHQNHRQDDYQCSYGQNGRFISSRMPDHICNGIVRCLYPARNITTTTSSNDVTKAKPAPETTPGRTNGRRL